MSKISLFLIFFFSISIAYTQSRKATLNHTAIFVVSVKASLKFYHTILGLDTIPEPFHDGKHAWMSIAPGAAMHIIEGAKEKKEYYKNQHTCFSVASVEAFTETLRREKMAWEDRDGKKSAITTRVDGVKQIWLRDPDGYWVEINDAKE